MSLLKEKSPFDIPELKNKNIEKIIKDSVTPSTFSVQPQVISQLIAMGHSPLECAVIITQLLRVFDELGSHPGPVYKALIIMLSILRTGHENFIKVCRALVPEIQTVLYLSFGEKRVNFRDQIHLIAAAIYDFLMYEAPLPDVNNFDINTSKQLHRPAPPPEANDPAPVVFLENPDLPSNPYSSSNAALQMQNQQRSSPVQQRNVQMQSNSNSFGSDDSQQFDPKTMRQTNAPYNTNPYKTDQQNMNNQYQTNQFQFPPVPPMSQVRQVPTMTPNQENLPPRPVQPPPPVEPLLDFANIPQPAAQSEVKVINMGQPEPAPVQPVAQEQEPASTIKTEKDLLSVTDLKAILRTQYDDSIESF